MRPNYVLSVTSDYTYKRNCQRAARGRNYYIDYARTMDDALNMLLDNDYVLVIIRADTVDYLSKMRIMKRLRPMPVLVLSYDTPQDMIMPMKMGADFFIASPFNLDYILELGCGVTRLYESGLYSSRTPKFLSYEYLHMDISSRVVLLKGNPLNLTPKEFDVLRLLMENEGDILAYHEIFKKVWGDEYADNAHNVLSVLSQDN